MIMSHIYKRKPLEHQREALLNSWDKKYYLYLMGMGTGKTKVAIDNAVFLYNQGEINSVLISSVSNVDGSASTRFRLTAIPNSNDIVPVRNQVLSIDTSNSSFSASVDEIESGSSQAGTGYTTTSSY